MAAKVFLLTLVATTAGMARAAQCGCDQVKQVAAPSSSSEVARSPRDDQMGGCACLQPEGDAACSLKCSLQLDTGGSSVSSSEEWRGGGVETRQVQVACLPPPVQQQQEPCRRQPSPPPLVYLPPLQPSLLARPFRLVPCCPPPRHLFLPPPPCYFFGFCPRPCHW